MGRRSSPPSFKPIVASSGAVAAAGGSSPALSLWHKLRAAEVSLVQSTPYCSTRYSQSRHGRAGIATPTRAPPPQQSKYLALPARQPVASSITPVRPRPTNNPQGSIRPAHLDTEPVSCPDSHLNVHPASTAYPPTARRPRSRRLKQPPAHPARARSFDSPRQRTSMLSIAPTRT